MTEVAFFRNGQFADSIVDVSGGVEFPENCDELEVHGAPGVTYSVVLSSVRGMPLGRFPAPAGKRVAVPASTAHIQVMEGGAA